MVNLNPTYEAFREQAKVNGCDIETSKRFWRHWNQRCQGRWHACQLFFSNMYHPESAGDYGNDMLRQFGDLYTSLEMHCAFQRYYFGEETAKYTLFDKSKQVYTTLDDKFEDIPPFNENEWNEFFNAKRNMRVPHHEERVPLNSINVASLFQRLTKLFFK